MTFSVAIVTNTLAEGGAERWASHLARWLDPNRFRVFLILLRDRRVYDYGDSAVVHCVDHAGLATTARTVCRIRESLLAFDADVVISNGNYTGQFVGQAVRGLPMPWIARFSGNFRHCRSTLAECAGWRWLDCNIKRAAVLVGNSAGVTGDIVTRWPSLKPKARTIPNGVDLCQLRRAVRPDDGAAKRTVPLILAAGRLSPQKRPDLFVESLSRLRDKLTFRAIWCGEGPLQEQTASHILSVGLDGVVELVGFRDDLPSLLAAANCFVLSSDHEGSPNVLAEAMGLGTPVVSTDCSYGPAEMIGQNRGWLVPTGDPTKLAEAVAEALTDSAEAERRSLQAKFWIEANLASPVILRQWERTVEELVASRTCTL